MNKKFTEIVTAALENNLDPVAALQDYLHEKDCPHIRRSEVVGIAARIIQEIKAQKTKKCPGCRATGHIVYYDGTFDYDRDGNSNLEIFVEHCSTCKGLGEIPA